MLVELTKNPCNMRNFADLQGIKHTWFLDGMANDIESRRFSGTCSRLTMNESPAFQVVAAGCGHGGGCAPK